MWNLRKAANRFRLLNAYLRGAASFSGMPAALFIEMTNRCNINCITCPRAELNAHPQDMSFGLFKRIVDEARPYAEFVDFSFRGESLLNDNIFQMIGYAKRAGMLTSLPTNGLLLSEANCAALLGAGLDLLTVSIDAFSEGTYSRIKRGGDYQHVVGNVRRMVELNNRSRKPLTIIVQMLRVEENGAEFKSFKAFWEREKRVFAKNKPFSSRAGSVGNKALVLRKGRLVRCSRIWKGLYVYADGMVVPCCNDFFSRHPLGDLNSQSIEEVWNGKAFVDLRRHHCTGEFGLTPMCGDCEFLGTDFHKQLATFVVDDLSVRQLLAILGPDY